MKTNNVTCSPTITPSEVQELADAIARDGIDTHRQGLADMADTAAETDLYPGAVAVLQDDTSLDAPRARAFMVLARNWPEIIDASEQRSTFNRTFRTLACRWERHRQLRQQPTTDLNGLWRSRNELESARAEVALLRLPR